MRAEGLNGKQGGESHSRAKQVLNGDGYSDGVTVADVEDKIISCKSATGKGKGHDDEGTLIAIA